MALDVLSDVVGRSGTPVSHGGELSSSVRSGRRFIDGGRVTITPKTDGQKQTAKNTVQLLFSRMKTKNRRKLTLSGCPGRRLRHLLFGFATKSTSRALFETYASRIEVHYLIRDVRPAFKVHAVRKHNCLIGSSVGVRYSTTSCRLCTEKRVRINSYVEVSLQGRRNNKYFIV